MAKIPQPPNQFLKTGEHHWLDHYDCDGHYFGRVILQWAPSAKQWVHSGNLATGQYVFVTEYWQYVCHQPMPE